MGKFDLHLVRTSVVRYADTCVYAFTADTVALPLPRLRNLWISLPNVVPIHGSNELMSLVHLLFMLVAIGGHHMVHHDYISALATSFETHDQRSIVPEICLPLVWSLLQMISWCNLLLW